MPMEDAEELFTLRRRRVTVQGSFSGIFFSIRTRTDREEWRCYAARATRDWESSRRLKQRSRKHQRKS